jgi:SpoVK/Ycf46/Vps4 family AAA+-type ATPase
MAAQAIARELGTETYVIDLSRVVSKYIGETEKFIDATFHDAQRAGAVLQIDEAEALFGRRSEVKDSHDRYANLEVAYLLQRMEAFDGVAILTTNLRQNVDQAFLRRLRFVIDFPKPDAAAREKIWRRCLPKGAPIKDVNFRFLSRRMELTGGHIRQITVHAAFAAAGEGAKAIEMRHLVNATRAELVKLGMVTAERDLAGWEVAQAA